MFTSDSMSDDILIRKNNSWSEKVTTHSHTKSRPKQPPTPPRQAPPTEHNPVLPPNPPGLQTHIYKYTLKHTTIDSMGRVCKPQTKHMLVWFLQRAVQHADSKCIIILWIKMKEQMQYFLSAWNGESIMLINIRVYFMTTATCLYVQW